jgi:adenine phosphoribosyltransferase
LNSQEIKKLIRDVPDFPSKGIIFKDITPVLANGVAWKSAVQLMRDELKDLRPTKLAGIESRGFVFASALAYELGIGVVLVRKKGKLPWKILRQSYALEYGTDEIEIHEDSFAPGERIVIVDDVLATGGTALAAALLCKKAGAAVAGILTLIELEFLGGRKKIEGISVRSILRY